MAKFDLEAFWLDFINLESIDTFLFFSAALSIIQIGGRPFLKKGNYIICY